MSALANTPLRLSCAGTRRVLAPEREGGSQIRDNAVGASGAGWSPACRRAVGPGSPLAPAGGLLANPSPALEAQKPRILNA